MRIGQRPRQSGRRGERDEGGNSRLDAFQLVPLQLSHTPLDYITGHRSATLLLCNRCLMGYCGVPLRYM